MSRDISRPIRQKGVVLIVVLWILALLMVLLAAFTSTIRVDRQVASDVVQRAKARAASDAAVGYLAAMHRLGGDDWQNLIGQTLILPGPDRIRFRIIPEEAYVSLTGASQELLTQLIGGLASTGQFSVDEVVEAILRWREPAEDSQPTSGDGRAVHSLDELLTLPGVTRRFIEALQPLVTMDSEHEGVMLQYAAAPLLQLLEGAVSGDLDAQQQAEAAEAVEQSGEWSADTAGELYRIQVELVATQPRKVEATVKSSDDAGFQIVRMNEYNSRFDLSRPR